MVIGTSRASGKRTFTAVIYKEEDLYVAECPKVGTVSQGYTIEKAVANLKEATELYLEEFPLPQVTRRFLSYCSKWVCTVLRSARVTHVLWPGTAGSQTQLEQKTDEGLSPRCTRLRRVSGRETIVDELEGERR